MSRRAQSEVREAEAGLTVQQRFRIARARSQRLLARGSAHTDWMNECVPNLMSYGKDQVVAVAACLNMWRQAWEEAHPDGADDPGPDKPQKQLQIARNLLRDFNPSQPRDEDGKWTSGGAGTGEHPGEGYSKDAKIIDGVIHTSNVNDAARALHENRKVELDQPRAVSILIDKLGEISKQMIEQGEQAPTFNLCNVTLKGSSLFCASSKDIPRIQMPQFYGEDNYKFAQHLLDKGYTLSNEVQFASHLRATQNELNGVKVASIAEYLRDKPDHQSKQPVFVSNDDYILDGHHRWAAKIGLDAADNVLGNSAKMNIARVNISIVKLLEEADAFGAGRADINQFRPWKEEDDKGWARMLVRAFNPDQPRDEEGKWTSTGGGSGAAAAQAPAASPTPSPVGPDKPKGKKKFTKDDFDKAKIKLNVVSTQQEAFLDKWNEKIGEDPATFKAEFMGGLDGTMNIGGSGDRVEISGDIAGAGDRTVGSFNRTIDLSSKSAKSEYFSLVRDVRGSDIGKKMLAGNVETYQRLGVEKVKVFANIDVGGYAWAKYGYVPDQSAWGQLRASLERKLTGGGSGSRGGGGTMEAEEWDAVPDQDAVYRRWADDSYDEFYESEVTNWRESGQPLETAKTELADLWDDRDVPDWANDAINEVREARREAGEPPIPYSNAQLHAALDLTYSSRYDDGRGDPDFTFDDDKLREPQGLDTAQPDLPGIPPEDLSKRLTEEMRDEIDGKLTSAFNDKADSLAENSGAPDYLSDSIREYQSEYWDGLEDEDRLRHAVNYGLADIEIEDEDESEEEVEATEEEKDPLLEAVRDPNPKAIWRVADSPKGKALLLGTNWDGSLNLKDPESLARFNAYVGKVRDKHA